jgi:hypothetical protein
MLKLSSIGAKVVQLVLVERLEALSVVKLRKALSLVFDNRMFRLYIRCVRSDSEVVSLLKELLKTIWRVRFSKKKSIKLSH